LYHVKNGVVCPNKDQALMLEVDLLNFVQLKST